LGSVLSHALEPFIYGIEAAALISFIEGVDLGPANRGVPQSFMDDCIEPSHDEVHATTLHRLLVGASGVDGLLESAFQRSFDATWRLKHKDLRSPQ